MAPDDRDRTFDKALSRHLRVAAAAQAAANLPAAVESQPVSCIDAETLAAYHERSLLPEEMNSAKEHIVGCAHCQAILAQLEVTDSISLAPADRVVKEKEVTLAGRPEKWRAPRPIRSPRWYWLAPAGALAAGLLVWVGLHENQPPKLLSSNEVKMAKVQEPPAPQPSLSKQAPATPSTDQFDELSRSRGVAGGVSGAISRDEESLKRMQKSGSEARMPHAMAAPVPPTPGKEFGLRKDSGADSSVALMQAEKQEDLDAKNAPALGVPQEQAAAQNQAGNIQAQNQMIAPKVAGPGPLSQAVESSKKAKSNSAKALSRAAAPPAPTPVTGLVAASAEGRLFSNEHLIAAPGTSVLWVAGHGGLIEFSSDRGASWSVQSSGVSVDLTTGSAPTDKICWIVGRAGTILVTSDGGAHWSIVHSPLEEDLGGVRASDALRATVWDIRNTKSFETVDGGVTWETAPVPKVPEQ